VEPQYEHEYHEADDSDHPPIVLAAAQPQPHRCDVNAPPVGSP
jgi:hypothetical protein